MPRIDDDDKRNRLDRIYLMLTRNARGITEGEISDEVNLGRRTVNNYLRELEDRGKAFKDGLYWYPLVLKESRLRSFDLSPEEAVTLYLGARLLVKQQDKRNEPAETALLKLASVLKADAGVGSEIEQAARELAQRPIQENYQPIFRDVMRGYIYRKKVEILYHPLSAKNSFPTTFSTYLLEPSPIGFTTYLIGHSSSPNALRAYKLERIESIRLTKEDYSVPPDFPGLEILRNAWSIVIGDETIRVVLRFGEKVKARVLETRWHPSQQTREDTEKPGSLLWEVQVADTLDLMPWVRGWGADVEVLEPKELRNALTREAQALAELYQVMEVAMKKIEYYGHSLKGKDKSEWQLLKTHLSDTARLAKGFGEDAGIGDLAYTAALLHDIGKYSKAFQARLDGKGHKVDHATAGAREVLKLFDKDGLEQNLATMLSYCIAGHHTGLPDYGDSSDVDGTGTLLSRVEKKKLEDFSAYKTEIDPASLLLKPRKLKTSNEAFSVAFMTRIVFSALVDADFQDTETFMGQSEKPRGGHASIEELCKTFNIAIQKFDNPQDEINKKRTETLKACVEKANSEQGFFTLTIPTGGGKTLTSMAFALNHAVKHGLKRVIYVIPFTSIIEQNAAVFKEYLGEENVLEHHSNFDWKKGNKKDSDEADDETKDMLDKIKLASENWDIPIVVTTNVQFFESLFANKSSCCRKLHNLAKSVIIFDEAQTLPREYLDPCMLAVKELVVNYGASTVFCTATQPALNKRLKNVAFTELAPDPQALFAFYKRVQVTNIGKTPDAALIEKIKSHSQALCIVNTRKHAKGLFDQLEGEGNFHLSTLMCPTHRKEMLAKIRVLLADKNKPTCRVISTQVMEAGIDVDFPVGFRALAGLDSIIQAAGRVNREMKRDVSDVFIFDPETPFIKRTPTFVEQGAGVAEGILRDFGKQPDSKNAIEEYFGRLNMLHNEKTAYDVKNILSRFDSGIEFDFKTAAQDFRLIDNNTVSVVIPYNEEAKKLIEKARGHPYPFSLARQLQMYTVNIYEKEFEKLQSKGVLETYNETYEVLTNMDFYDKETGLVLPAEAGGDALFFDG